jgi:hypothetical protein
MLKIAEMTPLHSTCDLDIVAFINTILASEGNNDNMNLLKEYIKCYENLVTTEYQDLDGKTKVNQKKDKRQKL